MIDYLVVMVPSVGLVGLAAASLVHALPAYIGAVAADVGWSGLIRLITRTSAAHGSVRAAASHEWVMFALPLIGALLAVPMIQFLYHLTLLRWRGRTIGKAIVDCRVGAVTVAASRLPRRNAFRRALMTTLLETGLISVALVAITLGQFLIGAIIWAISVAAFWMNVFIVLGPRRRTLVDRLAGTIVVRSTLYAQAAARIGGYARQTTRVAAVVARRGSELTSRSGHPAPALGVVGVDHLRRLGARVVELEAPAAEFEARQPPRATAATEPGSSGSWRGW